MKPRPDQLAKALAFVTALTPLAALATRAHAAEAQVGEAQVLAAPCAACHGPDGVSPAQIPAIAGKPQEDLVRQLLAFRDAAPADTTIMNRLMKGYDDAQIELLAGYFATVVQ